MFTTRLKMALVTVLTLFLSASIAAQQKSNNSSSGSIELDRYRLLSRVDLVEVDDDLSGITFNPLTQSLFAVTNEPPQILEMDLEGEVKRLIPLVGFEDTEGIAHIRGNRFAIVEERKRNVVFVSVDSATREIERQFCEGYPLPLRGSPNKGLEGVAWSERSGLLIAKEDEPEQLYRFDQSPEANRSMTSLLQQPEERPLLGDVAGLHGLENGNTLFLSEDSRLLLELSPQGKVLSEKSFSAFGYDPFELFHYVRQPEGVTVSDDGRLFIVSEPNQLFIFGKPAA